MIEEDVKLKEEGNKGVPIWEKVTLTVDEAAEYSNIGRDRLYELTNNPLCSFVLYVSDRKRLIKREAFEKYLISHKAI